MARQNAPPGYAGCHYRLGIVQRAAEAAGVGGGGERCVAHHPQWHPEEAVVTARSPAGAFGTKTVRAKRLSCRVGDTVRASAQGIALTLDEGACER